MRRASLALLLLTALGVGCSGLQVNVDYMPGRDFSGYRTFTWLPKPPRETGDYRLDNPLLDQRIRDAVVRALIARGYQQVVDRNPDFYVAYHLNVEERIDVRTVNRGYVDYWGYYVGVPETRVTQYDEGTLVIDIADAREKQLVWRGAGIGRLRKRTTPQQISKDVDEAVTAILAKFPPEAT